MNIKVKALLLPTLVVTSVVLSAHSGTHHGTDSNDNRIPTSGKIYMEVDPVFKPTSLDQLIRNSTLIVEGTVTSAD